MTHQRPSTKRLIAYWITTGLLIAIMLLGGVAQVLGARWNIDGMRQLGYPIYFVHLLGVWKLLGVIALLVPGFSKLKEWTYAGFFFVLTGAVISHLASGNGLQEIILPFVFVMVTVVSWWLSSNRSPQFA